MHLVLFRPVTTVSKSNTAVSGKMLLALLTSRPATTWLTPHCRSVPQQRPSRFPDKRAAWSQRNRQDWEPLAHSPSLIDRMSQQATALVPARAGELVVEFSVLGLQPHPI